VGPRQKLLTRPRTLWRWRKGATISPNSSYRWLARLLRSLPGVDLPAASAVADQMLDLAGREGSPATWGLAYACQVNACYFRGDLSGAEKHFIARAAMFEASAGKFPSVLATGFGFGSHVAWMLGHADAARDRIRQAIARATDLKSPFE
jgi:hypothetical protein